MLREDLALIAQWIDEGAHVLDLGCGDGALLAHLRESRRCPGYGVEIADESVLKCVRRGVNVIQADLDEGLADFADRSFDYVVMTQALQALARPDLALAEMLRVGREAIVTFPNFGHWRARWSIMNGRMPVTPALPAQWFNSENIHLCTVQDFEDLCRKSGWHVLERVLLDRSHRRGMAIGLLPGLFCEIALYKLRKPANIVPVG